jgi:hypothetical protein
MGIRKTLLIASTALVLPLAAHASPLSLNVGQGIEPAVATQHAPGSDSLYQEANSVKDWWDNLGEGGEKGGDRDDDNWDRFTPSERGEMQNERGQWSWRDNDDRDRNWWNENGDNGRNNWWNESGETGNKKNKWKHHKNNNNEGGEGGEQGHHDWWDND